MKISAAWKRTGLIAAAVLPAAVAVSVTPMALAAGQGASAAGTAPRATAASHWRIVKKQHFAGTLSGFAWVVAAPHGKAWTLGESGGVAPYTGKPLAAYWDGSRWTARSLPADPHCARVAAVGATSVHDIWVAGVNGCVLHYNGTTWKVARNWPAGRQLTGVTAISPSNVWVFGGTAGPAGKPGDGTWHYNGSSWQQVHGLGGDVEIASAASAHDIWAIGVTEQHAKLNYFVEHYNGSAWAKVVTPVLVDPQQILASSRSGVWLTGFAPHGGGPVLADFRSGHWHPVAVPGRAFVQEIIADGKGGLWIGATGSNGIANLALHRSAAGRWSSSTITTRTGDFLGGFAVVPGSSAVLAVGTVPAGSGLDAVLYGYGNS